MSSRETQTEEKETDLFFGKARKIEVNREETEKWFIGLSCVFLGTIAILSIIKLAHTPPTETEFTFALFIFFNTVFCILYVIHGVCWRRPYELAVLFIAIVGIELYSLLNFAIDNDRDPIKIARFFIICFISPPMMWFCVSYGRGYYRKLSQLKEDELNTDLFEELLKLDLQLGISMVILILNSTVDIKLDDCILLPTGIVFSCIWCTVGICSNRNEKRAGMVFLLVSSFLEPAYVLYKMVKSAEYTITDLKSTSLTCGVLALIVRMILIMHLVLALGKMGSYIVLEIGHSLRNINIDPLIRIIVSSGDEPIHELARFHANHSILNKLLGELNDAFGEISDKSLEDILRLAGKEVTLDNARMAVHHSIIYANNYGKPQGRMFQVPSSEQPTFNYNSIQ